MSPVKALSMLMIGAVVAGLFVGGGFVALIFALGDSGMLVRTAPTAQNQPTSPHATSPDSVTVDPAGSKPNSTPGDTLPIVARGADDKAVLAREAQAILKSSCYRCHGQEGAAEGGFNYVLDPQRLLASRKIVPGDSGQSVLYKRMKKDEMPPEEEKPRPTADEIAVLRKWIEAGAPRFDESPPRRTEITPGAVIDAIRADLEKAGERDRLHFRYFTITHLYNAGWSDDELSSYRIAISKLVNSLSWGKRVINPMPVDPARTILRIDLRDVKWSAKIWARVLELYPYGVQVHSPSTQFCTECTESPLPYVRGDWFVAAASRPPLYHDVLQIPGADRELEKLLLVDVEEDIRQERVCRAGFNGSGVSRNNRLIERHESAYGAYWKSYDFSGSSSRQNLFEYPLGPIGKTSFSHDGGEIIFSLPNGLQGYMLVDAAGRRIDKGPTSIVSDPRQADRAVVNGLSCMSCHSRGIIDKQDQVRESVMKNPKAFEKKDADTILALYPPKKDMDKLLGEDAERFAKAAKATGSRVDAQGRIVGSDPVVNLALVFERELDLALAAAEAGVEIEVFVKAIDQSPALARALGVLKVEGGTVARQAYITAYGDLVRELKVGEYIPGSGSRNTTSVVASGPLNPGDKLFNRAPVVYLADLPEFDAKNGEWPFTKDGTTGNKKDRIKVNRSLSSKGLGMHPPAAPAIASVKYRLGKQAAVFKTIVAINDTTNWCWSPATFTVLGDGKQLFESKNIAHNHDRTQECSLDVAGVDVLELRVRVLNGNQGVQAVWVEPRLLQRADTEDIPWPIAKKLFATGPRDYLSDLGETVVKSGPYPFGKDGEDGQGKAISIDGEKSPKGLGMHPPERGYAAVRYQLDKKAAVFKGAVGLNDTKGIVIGSGVFEVYGDGKRLWQSEQMGRQKHGPQGFTVEVTGVSELELRVVAEESNQGIHAVWLEPRVLQRSDTPDK